MQQDAKSVEETFSGRALVRGSACGTVLFSDTALSFWGGVDARSGEVIDRHHPLFGASISGKILCIPGGRGSCTGSSVLMELIVNGHAPAGVVVSLQEEILSLGVIVAEEVFARSIPVMQLAPNDFLRLREAGEATIFGDRVLTGRHHLPALTDGAEPAPDLAALSLILAQADKAALAGERGKAVQVAMRITLRMAEIQGARELIDIAQVHIDGCIYTGPTSLAFARQMLEWGARVVVPTTLNAISVDQLRWRAQGVAPEIGEPASALGDTYAAMGARKSFTCAPYQLESAPGLGEQVVWAESNAVVYANSVLGARTAKYPDYLDLCIALTGRAPLTGAHIGKNRRPTITIDVAGFAARDDLVYPLLGYRIGMLVGNEIPLVRGMEAWAPDPDDLKAFGAAFATTSGSPMFHLSGITPEAGDHADAPQACTRRSHTIGPADLRRIWDALNGSAPGAIDMVALGNPHFSFAECRRLAGFCRDRRKHADVQLVITCGRTTLEKVTAAGLAEELAAFGAEFITDACWCTLTEPVIGRRTSAILTNSAKFAHYGPGLTGKALRIASLSDCVEAAVTGNLPCRVPGWLDV